MQFLSSGGQVADQLEVYRAVDRSRIRHDCWVMGHMVAGLDGCAAIAGRVGALSTPPDAALFAAMRSLADVVLVGAETVRREGYGPIRFAPEQAQARLISGRPATPPLAVVSRSLSFDWSTRVFAEAPEAARTIVVTCAAAPSEQLRRATDVADVIVAGDERVDPMRALHELAARGHRTVICEGGPTWLGELVAVDLLDELCLTIAPLMGADPLPVSVAVKDSPLRRFALQHVLRSGDTLFLRYERSRDD